MKKIFFIILSVFSLSFLNVYAEETITATIENTNEEISTIQEEIYVASVDNEKFTSFDEALKYARGEWIKQLNISSRNSEINKDRRDKLGTKG